jgi:hypothetical protein
MGAPPLKTFLELEQEIVLQRLAALDWNRVRAASSLGKSVRWIRTKISMYRATGAKIFDPPKTGQYHSTAKLSEEEVRRIRGSSASMEMLAELYDVSKSTIYSIRHNLTWRHLK